MTYLVRGEFVLTMDDRFGPDGVIRDGAVCVAGVACVAGVVVAAAGGVTGSSFAGTRKLSFGDTG